MSPEVMAAWGGPERIQELPLDEPVVWSEVVGLATVQTSRYFREWGQPQGLIDTVAIGIVRDTTMVGSVAFGRHVR